MKHWWEAKKKNHDKRVDLYARPGVDQIIFKGEWKKRRSLKTRISYSFKQALGKIPTILGYATIFFLIYLLYITIGGSSTLPDLTPKNSGIIDDVSISKNSSIIDDVFSKLKTIGSETSKNENPNNQNSVAGTWELKSGEYTLKYLFNSDGTGIFFDPVSGEHYFTYRVENKKIILDDGVVLKLVKDDAFVQNVAGFEFTFKKKGRIW